MGATILWAGAVIGAALAFIDAAERLRHRPRLMTALGLAGSLLLLVGLATVLGPK